MPQNLGFDGLRLACRGASATDATSRWARGGAHVRESGCGGAKDVGAASWLEELVIHNGNGFISIQSDDSSVPRAAPENQ